MYTHKRGFTLMEMMISVGIIAVISAVVAYNHGKFNSDLEITNIAYRVALEARQAQVYGISVQQAQGAGGGGFSVAYGLRFLNGYDEGLIFFSDTNDDDKYTHNEVNGLELSCSVGGECIEELRLGRGNRIKKICGISSTALSQCSQVSNLHSIDILFKRPKTDAVINVYDVDYSGSPVSACSATDPNPCAGFAVCLQSPQGKEKQVVILSTGQISVENVAPSGSVCSGL